MDTQKKKTINQRCAGACLYPPRSLGACISLGLAVDYRMWRPATRLGRRLPAFRATRVERAPGLVSDAFFLGFFLRRPADGP